MDQTAQTRIDVAKIVSRVVARTLAERGLERMATPPASASDKAAASAASAAPGRSQRALVDLEFLARAKDGAPCAIDGDAVVTPLAEQQARRRGIRLVARSAAPRCSVAVGADHGGFALKAAILEWIREAGHLALDFGTRDTRPCDYPDFARAVAEAVSSAQCEFGVLIDGAGIGSAIAANKVPRVRAATCVDPGMARNAREHNFANVLCLGAKDLAAAHAREILLAFLATPTGAERHAARVAKIDHIEMQYFKPRSFVPGS